MEVSHGTDKHYRITFRCLKALPARCYVGRSIGESRMSEPQNKPTGSTHADSVKASIVVPCYKVEKYLPRCPAVERVVFNVFLDRDAVLYRPLLGWPD